jgi:mono/diheme cytochrome c family protein
MIRATVLAAGVLALTTLVACGGRTDTRELRDFERMRRQKRYDSYDVSHQFANGATMQAPPANTVSRETTLSDSASLPPTAGVLAIGAHQYAISCAVCHGSAGYGGGRLAPNLTEHRPVSLRSPAIAATNESALFETITNGKGGMPALGWQLSPAERRAIIAYIRSLSHATPAGEALADARADSAMAHYLQQIDSLQAAGAPIEMIAHLPRP